jgi:hypothetical protein
LVWDAAAAQGCVDDFTTLKYRKKLVFREEKI